MTRNWIPLFAGLALAAAAPALAQASERDHDRRQDRGRDQEDDRGRDGEQGNDDRGGSERKMSLDEAMAQAEKRYKARAVHGEERREGERIVYRIRLLDQDGRVFEVSVDAGSGRDK